MSGYVLINSHGDRSAIVSAWGPFPSEAAAKTVETELQAIGVDGLFEVLPLRALVPVAGKSGIAFREGALTSRG